MGGAIGEDGWRILLMLMLIEGGHWWNWKGRMKLRGSRWCFSTDVWGLG